MKYFIAKPKTEDLPLTLLIDIYDDDNDCSFTNSYEEADRVVFAKNWNRDGECIKLHQKAFHDRSKEIFYGFWYSNYRKECPPAPLEIVTSHVIPFRPIRFEEIILE